MSSPTSLFFCDTRLHPNRRESVDATNLPLYSPSYEALTRWSTKRECRAYQTAGFSVPTNVINFIGRLLIFAVLWAFIWCLAFLAPHYVVLLRLFFALPPGSPSLRTAADFGTPQGDIISLGFHLLCLPLLDVLTRTSALFVFRSTSRENACYVCCGAAAVALHCYWRHSPKMPPFMIIALAGFALRLAFYLTGAYASSRIRKQADCALVLAMFASTVDVAPVGMVVLHCWLAGISGMFWRNSLIVVFITLILLVGTLRETTAQPLQNRNASKDIVQGLGMEQSQFLPYHYSIECTGNLRGLEEKFLFWWTKKRQYDKLRRTNVSTLVLLYRDAMEDRNVTLWRLASLLLSSLRDVRGRIPLRRVLFSREGCIKLPLWRKFDSRLALENAARNLRLVLSAVYCHLVTFHFAMWNVRLLQSRSFWVSSTFGFPMLYTWLSIGILWRPFISLLTHLRTWLRRRQRKKRTQLKSCSDSQKPYKIRLPQEFRAFRRRRRTRSLPQHLVCTQGSIIIPLTQRGCKTQPPYGRTTINTAIVEIEPDESTALLSQFRDSSFHGQETTISDGTWIDVDSREYLRQQSGTLLQKQRVRSHKGHDRSSLPQRITSRKSGFAPRVQLNRSDNRFVTNITNRTIRAAVPKGSRHSKKSLCQHLRGFTSKFDTFLLSGRQRLLALSVATLLLSVTSPGFLALEIPSVALFALFGFQSNIGNSLFKESSQLRILQVPSISDNAQLVASVATLAIGIPYYSATVEALSYKTFAENGHIMPNRDSTTSGAAETNHFFMARRNSERRAAGDYKLPHVVGVPKLLFWSRRVKLPGEMGRDFVDAVASLFGGKNGDGKSEVGHSESLPQLDIRLCAFLNYIMSCAGFFCVAVDILVCRTLFSIWVK